jgi:CheY-like chemotaxis protein
MIKKKIVIVEDQKQFLELYKAIFDKMNNIQTLFETSGERGFELIKSENPNLIILDYKLPEMDGITLCKELRKIERFQKTPIIAVSSSPIKGNKKQIFSNAGYDKLLEKPINLKQFRKVVRRYLN